MRNMSELFLLRQFLGEGGWLTIVLAVGLFLIVIFRRETIAVPGLFRLAMLFFALSIALPPFMLPLASYINGGTGRAILAASGGESPILFMLVNAAGPVLQGLTVLCAFNAIMPRVFHVKPEVPVVPQKHPLDD